MLLNPLGVAPDAAYDDLGLTQASPLHVSVTEFAECGPRQMHMHAGLELGVLLSGRQERSFGNLTYDVSAGDVWLCGSWEPHGWRPLEPGTSNFVVEFLPQFLAEERVSELAWMGMFAAPAAARPRVMDDEMRRTCLAIGGDLRQEALGKPEGWTSMLRLLVARLLLVLARGWAPPPAGGEDLRTRTDDLGRVLPVLEQLNADPEHRVSLEEAARMCAMGRTLFTRVFRRTLGVSFGRYQ